jgi:hypothetical protein
VQEGAFEMTEQGNIAIYPNTKIKVLKMPVSVETGRSLVVALTTNPSLYRGKGVQVDVNTATVRTTCKASAAYEAERTKGRICMLTHFNRNYVWC